jgi:hypothetical protein
MENRSLLRLAMISGLLLMITSAGMSQEEKVSNPDSFWHRISVGGNFGFQFGTVTAIDVAPQVMVRIVDQFHAGVGFSYEYSRYKDYFFDQVKGEYLNFDENVYGGRIFFRYYLSNLFNNWAGNIFAHAEYEYLTYTLPFVYDPNGRIVDPFNYTYSRAKDRIEVNSLFVGGGYKLPVTNRVYLEILLLYNLNEARNSPYSNPVVRVGAGVTL